MNELRQRSLVFLVLALLVTALAAPVSRAQAQAQAQASAPQAPLVLVHGLFGSPSTTYEWATPWLTARGYVEGKTLFRVDLRSRNTEGVDLGVLDDAGYVAGEIRRILKETGAAQVDLVGNSRGGLVVRLVAEGESAPLVRRAVSIDAPHQGVLSAEKLRAMLEISQVRVEISLPADLQGGSAALTTLAAREARFADRRAPALAIGTTWQDGLPPVLAGHDGFVSIESQLAWPGARTQTFKIGPAASELTALLQSPDPFALVKHVPHAIIVETEAIWQAVYDFLAGPAASAPARSCEPNCADWTSLKGHWSEATVSAMLPDRLPYDLDAGGNRSFDPARSMTRAEFVYGLARATGLHEQLHTSAFADLRGHWSLGYVEAAVAAKLVNGLSADSFGPDRPLTRGQAAKLIAVMKGYPLSDQPSRFADVHGHWAEAYVEAAAAAGILKGDERGFRPDDQVTAAEAAVILSRAFPK